MGQVAWEMLATRYEVQDDCEHVCEYVRECWKYWMEDYCREFYIWEAVEQVCSTRAIRHDLFSVVSTACKHALNFALQDTRNLRLPKLQHFVLRWIEATLFRGRHHHVAGTEHVR